MPGSSAGRSSGAPVPLKPMLEQLLQDFAEEMEARGMTLREDLAVGEVLAEREGIREALANLLSNAVKFSPARGGAITVRSYRDGDLWWCRWPTRASAST